MYKPFIFLSIVSLVLFPVKAEVSSAATECSFSFDIASPHTNLTPESYGQLQDKLEGGVGDKILTSANVSLTCTLGAGIDVAFSSDSPVATIVNGNAAFEMSLWPVDGVKSTPVSEPYFAPLTNTNGVYLTTDGAGAASFNTHIVLNINDWQALPEFFEFSQNLVLTFN